MSARDLPEPLTVKETNPKEAAGDKRVPLWLLSSVAKIHWALAQFSGMIKYGAWNWRASGIRLSVYISAIERHVEALKNGEEVDPIDNTRHEGNIMACAAIILDARAAGMLIDDRPPRVDHRPALAEAEAMMVKLREQYKHMNPRHYTIHDKVEPINPNPNAIEK